MSNFLHNAIEQLLFHPVAVSAAECVGENFFLVTMRGEGLADVAWTPGQTMQFLVGSLTKRAYTPMDVDPVAASARFLFYRHGNGPGSAWAAALRVGDGCSVMRPKNSLDFAAAAGPAILFGDETSFAAAQALDKSRSAGAGCCAVLEVSSLADGRAVVARMELQRVTLVEKTVDGGHLVVAAQQMTRLAGELGAPSWFFTGCATSIQGVRKRLKDEGLSLSPSSVKPYWSPGRKGMD